ncbi:hypothetical protein BVC80_8707g21 [Macleaya cordata]|uniref:RNase H type-1 domain-containing protein n=1 Tax=Macleaya cordata TaxID=56857 RepID=A0A200Q135_MACCD|nr:hypothetical protein BVC80_8707g21 [Macleaya cordata]
MWDKDTTRHRHESKIKPYGGSTPKTITAHELQGIEAGLKLALNYGITNMRIGTDSKVVSSYFNSPNSKPPWHVAGIWDRIQNLRANFDVCLVEHIFRQTNRAVDKLASLRHTSEFLEITLSSFAEDLKKIIFEDKEGKEYYMM